MATAEARRPTADTMRADFIAGDMLMCEMLDQVVAKRRVLAVVCLVHKTLSGEVGESAKGIKKEPGTGSKERSDDHTLLSECVLRRRREREWCGIEESRER